MINSESNDNSIMRELIIGHLIKRREYLWNHIENTNLDDLEMVNFIEELSIVVEQITEFERKLIG